MKKIFILSVILLINTPAFTQVPDKMSYQAVIRDAGNVLVTNHSIRMRISILQGSVTGPVVYTETQTATTNSNGLVTVEIGGGTGFDVIDWGISTYFLKTETDPSGGTNYNITGTSQLLSVPYALHAKTADNGFSGNYYDLTSKPVLFDGNYNSLSDRPVLFDGNYNSLTNLPSLFDGNYNSLSNRPLLFDGNYNSLSDRPVLFDGNYNSLSNRPLLFDGNYNSLSNLPALFDGKYNSLTGSPVNISAFFNDAGYLTSFTEADPQVGINTSGYSPKWDGSALVTGSIYQDASGNIGIGTSSPYGKLQLQNGNFLIERALSTSTIALGTVAGTIGRIFAGDAGAGSLNNNYNKVIITASATNTDEMLRLHSGADAMSNTGTASIYFSQFNLGDMAAVKAVNEGGQPMNRTAGLSFWTEPPGTGVALIERMHITGSGNVGIGTATPAVKLDVNGIINATGGNSSNWNTAYSWGNHASAGYQPLIETGTSSQYWRGDKTWQTLDKSVVGLGSVENTALSTWTGSGSIASVGTITAGTWNAGAVTSSTVTATSFVKSGGTSSQFLKADGSVDSNTYLVSIREANAEFTAFAGQTAFMLSNIPNAGSTAKMYINGVRISNSACRIQDNFVIYEPANNGSYTLTAGDRIQIDYYY